MNTSSSSDDRSGNGPEPDGHAPEPEREQPPETAPGLREPAAEGAGEQTRDDDGDPYDPFIAAEPEDEEPLDAEAAGGATPAVAPGGGGLLGAETFAVAAMLAVGGALVGPRLVQMLSSVTAQDQVSAISRTIIGDGVVALVAVVLGLVSGGMANVHTRPWARWAAGAAVLIGVLFALISIVAWVLVPAPAPAPTGPPM
ncbi:hypothetical protein GCM10027570_35150 [Streptomonospora sediminis]